MKLSTYLVGIPVIVVTSVVAIANRKLVTFTLDPFSLSHPAPDVTIRLPLFALLLATLAVGAALGGGAAMLSRRSKDRAKARAARESSGLPSQQCGPKPPPT